MELIDNFRPESWCKGDPSQDAGFDTYRVMQKQPAKPQEVNTMTYAVFNQEGELRCLQLLGASSRDPLKGISNLALKVKDDQQIVGIIVEDECIVYNG